MRVATLTFHRALNYGSAMQAFALWKAIAALGHDVEVIDFAPEGQDDLYKVFSKPDSPRALLKNARALPFAGRLTLRRKSFSAFLSDNASLSGKVCHGTVDDELLSSYDAVVVGSDQIWNPNAKDFSTEYMLPRGDSYRRVAYAPSLNGASLDAVPDASALLSKFDALSAREASGAREIERVLGGKRRVETVLDPTLLLTADDFREAESGSSASIFSHRWISSMETRCLAPKSWCVGSARDTEWSRPATSSDWLIGRPMWLPTPSTAQPSRSCSESRSSPSGRSLTVRSSTTTAWTTCSGRQTLWAT